MFPDTCRDLRLHLIYMRDERIENFLRLFLICMVYINRKKTAQLRSVCTDGSDRYLHQLLKISGFSTDLLRNILHHRAACQHGLIRLKDRIRIVTVLVSHPRHDLVSGGNIEINSRLSDIIRTHIDPNRVVQVILLVNNIVSQVLDLSLIRLFILLIKLQIRGISQIRLFPYLRITLALVGRISLHAA